VVEGGSTVLALVNEPNLSDSALAVAAGDVVVLEMCQADLLQGGAYGIGQLEPLLQRALRLHALKPQKKLLMVVVTDADGDEASAEDLAALTAAGLASTWAKLKKPRDCAATSVGELFDVQVSTLPSATFAADEHAAGLEALSLRFTDPDSADYLFPDGRYSVSSSAALACLSSCAKEAPLPPPTLAPSPAALAAYRAAEVAEATSKHFAKGLAQLKKEADPAFLPDFGDKAGALFSDCLAQFDEGVAAFGGVPAVVAARSGFEAQLLRALHVPFRKQLTHLQRLVLSKFTQKKAALKPSIKVEEQTRDLVKEAEASFNEQAAQLLAPSAGWSYAFERDALVATIKEQSTLHVDTLRVQGLYLPEYGGRMPIDFSAHWLMLSPFGTDMKNDPIRPKDKPKFRPQVNPMKTRATDGYKVKFTDPKRMVFTDKMIQ